MTVQYPAHRKLFYGGGWHDPVGGNSFPVVSPGNGADLGVAADASAEDVDAAVAAAKQGLAEWRQVPPLERARILREVAGIFRDNAETIAKVDAMDSGNPVKEVVPDVHQCASWYDFFAGLVTEMKGASIPYGPDCVNFSVREPRGVVARIVAFNHPFMFAAGKLAAPLAAGNSVIVKPPEQSPLGGLLVAEMVGHLFPKGTLNVVTGGREAGAALSSHKDIAMVTLVGSVPTGRAIMKAAADTLKPTIFELGGKNALVAYDDAEVEDVAQAAVAGMNFGWCGQSCGSTSRLFLHDAIHDAVVERIAEIIRRFKPGDPTDSATTMGCLNNRQHYERVLDYIEIGKAEGATLICGGGRPSDETLKDGLFIEPTVFVDVTQNMRIASEEIFGPVLSIIRWSDEAEMVRQVNSVEYGLTCSIWTPSLSKAHRMAAAAEAGYVWVNKVGKHFLGAPFGGYKQSGLGRENCLEELLSFTQEKNIHIVYQSR